MSISYYTVNGQTGTAQTIGNSTYYSSPYGNYSATQIGGQTFYSGDLKGSSYSSGGNTYYNLDGIGNITAQPIGNTTYYNTPLGSFNAQTIGNQTFYSGSINGSAQTIDDTLYFDLPGLTSSYNRYIDILTGIQSDLPTPTSGAPANSAPPSEASPIAQSNETFRLSRGATHSIEFIPGVTRLEIDDSEFQIGGMRLIKTANNVTKYRKLAKKNKAHFIYSSYSGVLSYDSNSESTGFGSMEQIAYLTNKPRNLSSNDFTMI